MRVVKVHKELTFSLCSAVKGETTISFISFVCGRRRRKKTKKKNGALFLLAKRILASPANDDGDPARQSDI